MSKQQYLRRKIYLMFALVYILTVIASEQAISMGASVFINVFCALGFWFTKVGAKAYK